MLLTKVQLNDFLTRHSARVFYKNLHGKIVGVLN